MGIRGIVLLAEPKDCATRIALAVRIAEQNGAELTGLCRYVEPIPDLADCYAAGPGAVAEVLAHQEADIAAMVAPVEAAFRSAAAAADVQAFWTLLDPGTSGQEMAKRVRSFDLAVIGRPEAHDDDARRLVEGVVFHSGTPCLVVPEEPQALRPFERILVAWNNSREARRAVEEGLPFLKAASAVRLTRIAETPGDEAADHAILNYLVRHGVNAKLERIEGIDEQAGLILLHQLSVFEGDLLIMGAYHRSPVAETILGGATKTILARAYVPVLMSH